MWSVLIHPSSLNIPGKTELLDDTVIVDDASLSPLLEWLTRNHRDLNHKVWDHDVKMDIALFLKTATALGLGALRPCRYSLRHAGASHDVLSRRRLASDVKKRGRWRADSSVKRYAKDSLAMAELHKVPLAVRTYGARAAPAIVSIPLGVMAPPPPPRLNMGADPN